MVLPRKAIPQPFPDNMCTVEHLKDQFDPARQVPAKEGEVRHVAACWRCNFDRSIQRIKENQEEHDRRSREGQIRATMNADPQSTQQANT